MVIFCFTFVLTLDLVTQLRYVLKWHGLVSSRAFAIVIDIVIVPSKIVWREQSKCRDSIIRPTTCASILQYKLLQQIQKAVVNLSTDI